MQYNWGVGKEVGGGPDKHQPTFAVRRDSPLGSTVVGRDLGGSKIEGGWSPFLRVAEAGGVSGIFTGAVGITVCRRW